MIDIINAETFFPTCTVYTSQNFLISLFSQVV